MTRQRRWRRVMQGPAFVALTTSSRLALAGGPPVALEASGCDSLPIDEARRVLAVELGSTTALADEASATRVTVTCRGSDALIQVSDPLSKKKLDRTVALGSENPLIRGRLLGVASAELVLASWAELATNPEPRVPAVAPPASPEVVKAVRDAVRARFEMADKPRVSEPRVESRPFRVAAVVARRAFFSFDGAMWGGGVRVGQDVFTHVGWTADALFESGEIGSSTGRYRLDSATVGGAIYAYQALGPLVARAGAGLRLGVAATRPVEGDSNSSTLAPWGWPTGTVSLTLNPVGALLLEAAGEVGYVVIPVASSGPGDATLSGGWFGVQAGVGFGF